VRERTEATLREAISRNPDAVLNYLDLARCYYHWQRLTRLDEIELLVTRGLTALRADPALATPAAGNTSAARTDSPAIVKRVPAAYPADAQALDISGVVFINTVIDAKGDVRNTRVVGSIPALDRAAETAVWQWKFSAAETDGRPAVVTKLLTLKFGAQTQITPADVIEVAAFHYAQRNYRDAEAVLAQAVEMIKQQRAPLGAPIAAGSFGAGAYRAGGVVAAPKLVADQLAVYPASAVASQTQGRVLFDVLVSKEGVTRELLTLGGPPTLINAAIGAVGRRRYEPAVLNGEPVDVVFTVSVDFTLK
jgi:TonB family protein